MANQKQLAHLVLKGITQGSYPRLMYKYREFNNYTESIFKDHSLWFSRPADFNDPFDCKIVDRGNYTAREVTDYLINLGVPAPKAAAAALDLIRDQAKLTQVVEELKDDVFNKRGILALSKCADSILMWSYYCGGHKGFVLGFDATIDPGFFVTSMNVKYAKTYPAFQYLKEKDKIVTHGMVSKLDDWDHEKEIRVIKPTSGLHSFDKKCLVEVIVGCKMPDRDRDRLIKYLCDYGYDHVRFKRTVPSQTAFQLTIEDLTIQPAHFKKKRTP